MAGGIVRMADFSVPGLGFVLTLPGTVKANGLDVARLPSIITPHSPYPDKKPATLPLHEVCFGFLTGWSDTVYADGHKVLMAGATCTCLTHSINMTSPDVIVS